MSVESLLNFLIRFTNRNSILFKLANDINNKVLFIFNKKNIKKKFVKSKQIGLNSGESIKIINLDFNNCEDLYHLLSNGFSKRSQDYLKLYNVTRESVYSLLRFKTSIVFGAYHHNELVAYGVVKLFLRNSSFIVFGVKESWEKKGVGSALVRFMVEINKKNDFKTYAIIDKENAASYNHLLKLGFMILKKTKEHFFMNHQNAQ